MVHATWWWMIRRTASVRPTPRCGGSYSTAQHRRMSRPGGGTHYQLTSAACRLWRAESSVAATMKFLSGDSACCRAHAPGAPRARLLLAARCLGLLAAQ